VTAQWQWAAAVYTTLGSDYNGLGVKVVDGVPAGQSGNLRAGSETGEGNDSVGAPKNLVSFVIGGARGEGGTDFTGSFGTALKVTPCAASSGSQLRMHSNLSDRSMPHPSGILATVGMAVSKNCPATAAPSSTVTCTFSVQNLDSASGVASLVVTNTVPVSGGSPVAVQCKQGGVPVSALGPNGGATDTCTGSVDEPTPACGSADTPLTDEIDASGNDNGQFAFGFAQQTVTILACTPTPTNTPTDTPTSTPTNTPTSTPTNVPTNTPTNTPTPAPTPGNLGCTPGFWKNHPLAWQCYSTGQALSTVFTFNATCDATNSCNFSSLMLIDALSLKGGNGICGAEQILLRAGVAALLNACATSGVPFPMSTADVIKAVNDALASCDRTTILNTASTLDGLNNGPGGCPLGGPGTRGISFRN
jgi:hypothetical protein